MFTQDTIDNLRELPLMDVIAYYPDVVMKKCGASYKGLSPWTNEKTPSFIVHPGKNIYKDFSSGKGGNNAISFVMAKENVNFIDAVKSLASLCNFSIAYTENTSTSDKGIEAKNEIYEVLQWALAQFCSNEVPDSFRKGRDFPDDVLDKFKVGYATPSWSDLTDAGLKVGIKPEVLMRAGLIRKRETGGFYDYFRDRVIFPLFDLSGNVIAFIGRDAGSSTDSRNIGQLEGAGHTTPKYINSPDTTYDEGKHLFGLYQALKNKKGKGLYLVEGPTDVMRMHQQGMHNTVSPCGSSLTEYQAGLIAKHTDRITIVPDNDCGKDVNAGLDALHRNAAVAIKAGLNVSVLIPGNSKN